LQAFLGTFWQTSLGTCLQSCLLQKKMNYNDHDQ
jgi:hypothetical protein